MDALTSTRGSQDQIAHDRPPDRRGTLGSDELRRIDAYWSVVNYLSVGQIYLYDNPLLSELLFTRVSFRSDTSSHIAGRRPGRFAKGRTGIFAQRRMRIGVHLPVALRSRLGQFRHEPAIPIEQFLGLVTFHQSEMLSGKKATTKARVMDALLQSRSWREIVAPHARADRRRAVAQLLNTGLPFLLVMAALLCGARSHPGLTLPLAVPAALLLVRLFAIQHDCGHGSFFASRRANDLLGRVLGVLTLTPYACWRKSHAIHHANSGNLDRRGTGDVRTLTVREYQSLSLLWRIRYRVYRHPMVLFGLGPIFLFAIHHRIPAVSPFRHRKIWGSILGTDAALAAIVVLMLLTVVGAP